MYTMITTNETTNENDKLQKKNKSKRKKVGFHFFPMLQIYYNYTNTELFYST
jgi:hypothetical protein